MNFVFAEKSKYLFIMDFNSFYLLDNFIPFNQYSYGATQETLNNSRYLNIPSTNR